MVARLQCAIPVMALACTAAALAEPAAALRDAAARIDYGWYTGDVALIHAARDSLDASGRDAEALSLRAYAGYRGGRLAVAFGTASADELEACVTDAEAAMDAGDGNLAVEANVLIAACSALSAAAEPLRSVWHQRRLRQAIAAAGTLAPDNPRLLLVSRLHLDDISLPIESVVAAFRSKGADFPDWGEAEARLLLAEHCLANGDLRGARDALEETLLIAPDYTAALDLRERISALAATH